MNGQRLPVLKGQALVDHMQQVHGYVTWNPPRPNTQEYRTWKAQHDDELHGRWAGQQEHHHG